MSGGVKAVSSGRSRLNAFWSDMERAANEEENGSSVQKSPTSQQQSSEAVSPLLESTTQQAGKLFSNFSSFLSRKTREFSQAMEVIWVHG